MKWLIASDIHGNAACCKKLMEAYDREGADRLLLLGDVLYHGLGDGDKRAVADMLNAIAADVTCVQGNCDSESDMAMLDFPMTDDYVTIFVGSKKVFATHGHIYNNTYLPPAMEEGDVLLTGHTHVPATEPHPHYLYFNPGSVSRPQWGSERGYMTLEDGTFLWKTLDGDEYRRYSIEK